MSGRVLVDDEAAGDPLLYASNKADPAWHRFGVTFADGGTMYLRDPRRLGAVELDPDEDRLGPDAFDAHPRAAARDHRAGAGRRSRRCSWTSRASPGSATCSCDEALWRAGIDPARPADDLADDEVKRLHRAIRDTLRILGRRGGSHTGDLTSRPRSRAALPEGRRAAAAPHGRRPHHLLVPRPPGDELAAHGVG